ncbi:beta-glucuronidase-like isoform X2 [Asterias amurensis]|uniref:beta-glucuronidase-like isoform X2 n=1 Tax=Asterias amurensis TaxID=7602 RepID=UPI003AB109B6
MRSDVCLVQDTEAVYYATTRKSLIMLQTTLLTCCLMLVTSQHVFINEVPNDESIKPKPMLYPRESLSREIKDLNGLWNFRADVSPSRNEGFVEKWFEAPLAKTGAVIDMPVPSSFNDVTQSRTLRDFVGWVWYDREFYPPAGWKSPNVRVVLRFASAHYNTVVWLNGMSVMTHEGGHLPFEADITDSIVYNQANRITVALNNTLTPTTLPPGSITFQTDTKNYPPGYFVQNVQFDFFNYAGIHRSVQLYTTPSVYISDITVTTDINSDSGVVNYKILYGGTLKESLKSTVVLQDAQGETVAESNSLAGKFTITNAHLWWPYTMSEQPGYLYTLKVSISCASSYDEYHLPVGIRTVSTTNKQFFINEKPFYFHGVGKHEDADIRGKGLDLPLIIKDINLMKWLGANAVRTSHYPYSEEFMDQCDRHGIVVIDESPGVGITKARNMGNVSLVHHLSVMMEMYQRDKNRPSVVMWSVANEPASTIPQAVFYFGSVINFTRSLDPTRMVTFVMGGGSTPSEEKVAQWCDVLCLNNYFSWYTNSGHLEVIELQSNSSFWEWHLLFNKTIMQTEYGADTIPGLHMDPAQMFTEEYQCDMLAGYHKTFDNLRHNFLTGELIWNFADFMTEQSVKRVVGNKKGIFTRQRQPKAAAHLLRRRYQQLSENTVKY